VDAEIRKCDFTFDSISAGGTAGGYIAMGQGVGAIMGISISRAGLSTDIDLYLGTNTITDADDPGIIYEAETINGSNRDREILRPFFLTAQLLYFYVVNADLAEETGEISVEMYYDAKFPAIDEGSLTITVVP